MFRSEGEHPSEAHFRYLAQKSNGIQACQPKVNLTKVYDECK